jgi:uncharacterized protein involved in cysteine biosynthesis
VIKAFSKAIGQFGDPNIRRVVWISVGASAAIFALLWLGVGFLLTDTSFFDIGWLETAIDVLGGLATLVITWLLFPAVVSATVGFLLDRVADAVEEKHYPHLPEVRETPMGEIISTTLRFLAIMVGLNLVILVFLLFPPLFPFVFYGVNGYLLGREYFELVALRRLEPSEAKALRKRHQGTLFVAGVATAFVLTVPIVNLLAPIIATAAMVHLLEGWRPGGSQISKAPGTLPAAN